MFRLPHLLLNRNLQCNLHDLTNCPSRSDVSRSLYPLMSLTTVAPGDWSLLSALEQKIRPADPVWHRAPRPGWTTQPDQGQVVGAVPSGSTPRGGRRSPFCNCCTGCKPVADTASTPNPSFGIPFCEPKSSSHCSALFPCPGKEYIKYIDFTSTKNLDRSLGNYKMWTVDGSFEAGEGTLRGIKKITVNFCHLHLEWDKRMSFYPQLASCNGNKHCCARIFLMKCILFKPFLLLKTTSLTWPPDLSIKDHSCWSLGAHPFQMDQGQDHLIEGTMHVSWGPFWPALSLLRKVPLQCITATANL
jgi:hypothetical protein